MDERGFDEKEGEDAEGLWRFPAAVLCAQSVCFVSAGRTANEIAFCENGGGKRQNGEFQLGFVRLCTIFGETFFKNAAVSAWPLFKAFTMLMYALIAFCPRWQIAARRRDRTKRMKAEGGTVSVKSKVVAALLAFFLGETGAHRYYLGYRKQGAIQTCGLVSLVVGWAIYIPAMMGESITGLLLSDVLLLYAAAIGIWVFVDFIRILTGGLTPEDGSAYSENRPVQVQMNRNAPATVDVVEAIEKLARLHGQGILTDEEFQQKKTELLSRM